MRFFETESGSNYLKMGAVSSTTALPWVAETKSVEVDGMQKSLVSVSDREYSKVVAGFSPQDGKKRHAGQWYLPPKTDSFNRRLQLLAKRLIDIARSALLLILLGSILLATWIGIRATSPWPALFTQDLTGLANRIFRVFKFRSMYVDDCDRSGVAQTAADDPRITPIGRVIRRTNLDELPQLINVLKGEMSLVGPRPHVPGMLAAGVPCKELVSFYPERHRVRPGITGLTQSQGLRGPTVDPEKAELRSVRDLECAGAFSLWLDVKIVYWTIVGEIRSCSGF